MTTPLKLLGTTLRWLMACMLMCITSLAAHAIPAYPGTIEVRQPNGTMLTITLQGDEHGYLALTTDGVPVVQNAKTGAFEYARLTPQGITASGIEATNAAHRNAEAQAYVARMDIDAIKHHVVEHRAARLRDKRNTGSNPYLVNDFPTTGSQRSLVILVEFSGTEFTSIDDPHTYYNEMLNLEGFTHANGAHGSARDFYHAGSFGKFDPQFDVIGPVQLPHPLGYYGGDSSQLLDTLAYQMVIDACQLADPLVDFSLYDLNNDGMVDNIYFFYAGFGQADSGQSQAIWPHAGKLNEDWHQAMPQHDGVYINRYATSNEIRYGTGPLFKPVGIGTFVHEFAHVLGLVDHYDTGYGGGFHPDIWDVMAAGSYNDNQNTPPTFSAFERAELGWLEYTEITPTTQGMLPLHDLLNTNTAYRIMVPGTDDREYFVFENRQLHDWDRTLPGHGMLVWHIDKDLELWHTNKANADASHQRIDIVEADKVKTSNSYGGDPFPGTSHVTTFDFYSWAQDNLFSLDWVEEVDSTINFLLARTGYTLPAPTVNINQVLGHSLTFSWSEVPEAKSYLVTVEQLSASGNTIVGNYDRKDYDVPSTITIEGLEPLSNYRVTVVSKLSSYESEPAVANVTTTEVQFVETAPVAIDATDVTATGFTAHWHPLEGAEGYSVSVMENKYSNLITEAYGFENRADGMPDAWTTSSSQYNTVMFGQSKPSLQLAKQGDYIEMVYPEAKIVSLTFWQRSQMGSNQLFIEERNSNDDEWTQVMAMNMSTTGEVVALDIDSVAQVRISFERKGSYALLDDIEVGYVTLDQSPVANFTNLAAGNNLQLAIKGLPHAASYAYRVQGIQGTTLSAMSNTIVVTMGEGVEGDVNGDGTVTSADITTLYDWLLNNDDSSLVNGDVDGDGAITSGDVTAVYNILLGT